MYRPPWSFWLAFNFRLVSNSHHFELIVSPKFIQIPSFRHGQKPPTIKWCKGYNQSTKPIQLDGSPFTKLGFALRCLKEMQKKNPRMVALMVMYHARKQQKHLKQTRVKGNKQVGKGRGHRAILVLGMGPNSLWLNFSHATAWSPPKRHAGMGRSSSTSRILVRFDIPMVIHPWKLHSLKLT